DQPSLALRQDGRIMTVTLSRRKHTVTNARRPVRHERSDQQRSQAQASNTQDQPMPVVAVTGAAPRSRAPPPPPLPASPGVKKVTAIDSDRGGITGVPWRLADVRDPALARRLAGADIVVHADHDLAPDSEARPRRAYNVRGTQTVLTAAAAGRVGRVVLVTS